MQVRLVNDIRCFLMTQMTNPVSNGQLRLAIIRCYISTRDTTPSIILPDTASFKSTQTSKVNALHHNLPHHNFTRYLAIQPKKKLNSECMK